MKTQSALASWVLSGLLLALAPACSSSDTTADDAAVPIPDSAGPAKDTAPITPDAPLADSPIATGDAGRDAGAGVDVIPGDLGAPDALPGSDGRIVDTAADTLATDLGPATKDSSADQSADGFDPGPVVPLIVNSGPTATYNLVNGTWKVFSFDAEANQVYSVSGLGGGGNGYLGPAANVSPTNFQAKTNADGNLAFVAPAAQKYFLAVAAQGAGVSGSFQVADGGRLLALGKQSVSLTAPTGDDYVFFHFPVSASHTYSVLVEGPSTPSVGLGFSARAERASSRQFSYPLIGLSGPLPMTQDIPTTSVVESYSGYYYLFVRLSTALTINITVTQTS